MKTFVLISSLLFFGIRLFQRKKGEKSVKHRRTGLSENDVLTKTINSFSFYNMAYDQAIECAPINYKPRVNALCIFDIDLLHSKEKDWDLILTECIWRGCNDHIKFILSEGLNKRIFIGKEDKIPDSFLYLSRLNSMNYIRPFGQILTNGQIKDYNKKIEDYRNREIKDVGYDTHIFMYKEYINRGLRYA